MAITTVASASELEAAIQSAQSGDTVSLAAGDYGDVAISSRAFADSGLTITSDDPTHAATFNSLAISGSSGIHFVGVDVSHTSTAATTTFSSVVDIATSQDVSFSGGAVTATSAVAGVGLDAAGLDSSRNVVGLQTARGFTIDGSSGVTVEGVDIHHLYKGVVLANPDHVILRDNVISDVRTSHIVGGGDYIIIDGNRLSGSTPWGWGDATKDHADFIHLYTDTHVASADEGIQITGNALDQGGGVAILGISIEDNSGYGFENLKIADNLIVVGNTLGMRLENTFNSSITGNTLLEVGVKAPGIVLTTGTHDIEISGNLTAFVSTSSGATGNVHDNIIIQNDDRTIANYYDPSVAAQLAGMSPDAAFDYLSTLLANTTPYVPTATELASYEVVTQDTDANLRIAAKGPLSQQLVGGRGSDTITGLSGQDTLAGGDGDDYLSGAGGADVLLGGRGADKFVFAKSYVADGAVDTIVDFVRAEGDRIYLNSIDAVASSTTSDQAFKFIGTQAFHNVAGELRFEVSEGYAVVYGDVTGDGVSDFSLKLLGVTSLQSSDFVL